MQSKSKRLTVAACAALTALVAPHAVAELIYLTSGADVARIDSASPGTVTSTTVTGLQAGDTLLGIDVRPANQLLYGIGSSSRVYTINPVTGAATFVGGPAATPSGAKFGVDFNPVPDRIRFTSDTNQSVRLNPNDGTLAGTDTNLSATGIAEVAYTNNFAGGGGATTLFGISSTADQLVMIGGVNGIPSPNLGAVSLVGNLGVDTSSAVGFDISGLSGTAFAALNVGGLDRLYTVNLSTGAATLVGTIGAGATPYLGLAAAAAPEPTTITLLALPAMALLSRRRRRA